LEVTAARVGPEQPRPLIGGFCQIGTKRIAWDVAKFLRRAFIVAEAVLEEIALPFEVEAFSGK
jgi:hypothetical protein